MRLQFLAVLGNDRRVEDNREQSTEQLVVNLYPLAVDVGLVVCRVIRVGEVQSSQREVDELDSRFGDDR